MTPSQRKIWKAAGRTDRSKSMISIPALVVLIVVIGFVWALIGSPAFRKFLDAIFTASWPW